MEGVERLKGMLGGSFQKPLLKIFMYLKTREDMDEKYLNPDKSLEQMYEYIKSEAKKQAVNNVAVIDDTVVYSLAIHYFDETNESLGLVKKEVKKNTQNNKLEDKAPLNKSDKEEQKEQISFFEAGGAA